MKQHISLKTYKYNSIEVTSDLLFGKKCQSTYYSASYEATALKICHDTDLKKVGEQHVSLKISKFNKLHKMSQPSTLEKTA